MQTLLYSSTIFIRVILCQYGKNFDLPVVGKGFTWDIFDPEIQNAEPYFSESTNQNRKNYFLYLKTILGFVLE